MQLNPASRLLFPVAQDIHLPLFRHCCLPPFCCFTCPLDCGCAPRTTLHFGAGTDRSSYAPGETIRLWINLTSDREDLVSSSTVRELSVTLNQHVHLSVDGSKTQQSFPCATMQILPPRPGAIETELRVPSVSPTYKGGLGQDKQWFQEAARFGERWKQRPDPVTWDYTITVQANIKMMPVVGNIDPFILSIPVTICGLGLVAMGVPEPPLRFGMVNGRLMAGAHKVPTDQPLFEQASAQMQQPQPQSTLLQAVHAEPPMSRLRPSGSPYVVPLNTEGFEFAPTNSNSNPQGGGQVPDTQTVTQTANQPPSAPELALGGYAMNTNNSATNMYGFTGDVDALWKGDEAVKKALPALRSCQLVASIGGNTAETCMIRDAQEDYNPQDVGELAYKPVFFMSSSPVRRDAT